MMRKIIGAAILTGAAVAVTAAVKIVMDRKESDDSEVDDEVHFISIEDDEEPGEDVANIEDMSESEEPEEEKEIPAEVQEIGALYPYLDADFIAEQLNRNEEFNRQYPEDTLITISHKAAFANKEIAEQYRGIAEANGYIFEPISDTENVVTRRLFMENGAILSDIYNVANQIACLKGGYEGYQITA